MLESGRIYVGSEEGRLELRMRGNRQSQQGVCKQDNRGGLGQERERRHWLSLRPIGVLKGGDRSRPEDHLEPKTRRGRTVSGRNLVRRIEWWSTDGNVWVMAM
jgi:hypothetical protein